MNEVRAKVKWPTPSTAEVAEGCPLILSIFAMALALDFSFGRSRDKVVSQSSKGSREPMKIVSVWECSSQSVWECSSFRFFAVLQDGQ